ncbi:flagellar protein [Geobacter pelophilus]|uniref:Flagellar protein n=1 Tax=Geoanaerobacter pelophilus TaxID=60036 RepID=A0AAW4KYY4_9BACT|nr:flagellar protein [Geoanaerobacter pelophilus]
MVDRIFIPSPIQVPTQKPVSTTKQSGTVEGGNTFAKVLQEKLPSQGVRFSQHAQDRLKARGISFSENDLQKLEGAVDSVAKKGGRESLVMLGDAALVVSVKNRTVVTAVDRQSMKGNVFTNIDSAVVL